MCGIIGTYAYIYMYIAQPTCNDLSEYYNSMVNITVYVCVCMYIYIYTLYHIYLHISTIELNNMQSSQQCIISIK